MRRRGNTLIEVLVAAAMSLVVLLTAYSAYFLLNRASRTQNARIDARHQIQAGLALLRSNLSAAKYIFTSDAGSNPASNYTMNNHTYALSSVSDTSPTSVDVLCAEPVATPDVSTNWKIFGFYLRTGSDPNNPTAQQIVEEWADSVSLPNLTQVNSCIDLSSVSNVSTLVLDASIDSSTYGVQITGSPTNFFSPRTAFIQFGFKLRPTDVSEASAAYTLSENFETRVFPRNQ